MTTTDIGHPAGRRRNISGWSGRTIVTVTVAIFVLFFLIPIVWLLLATTKSAHGLIVKDPFLPGSTGAFTANWHQLFGFQDGAVIDLDGQLGDLRVRRTSHHARRQYPSGLRAWP